jgi:hypothetical protein
MNRAQLKAYIVDKHKVYSGTPTIANTERALASVLGTSADYNPIIVAGWLETLSREAERLAKALLLDASTGVIK